MFCFGLSWGLSKLLVFPKNWPLDTLPIVLFLQASASIFIHSLWWIFKVYFAPLYFQSWASELPHFLSSLRIFSLTETRQHLHSQHPCPHLKNSTTKQSSAPPTSLVKWLGLLPEHQRGAVDRSMGDTTAATQKGLHLAWMMGSPYREPPSPSLPHLTYPSPSLRSLGHVQVGLNCIQTGREAWLYTQVRVPWPSHMSFYEGMPTVTTPSCNDHL